jgi:2-succinyl-6-hydroxy-2,4-cyclohexadiene-1-carboxylate synthase
VPATLVLLHGFSGTSRAWDGVAGALDRERYIPLALDLPGHGGEGAAPRPITFGGAVESVLARAPASFALCGYSLGGRVALHVALAAPQRVRRLVLVSCSAGIEDESERARRRGADEALAQELERGAFADWIERWRAQPVFAGEPRAAAALAREDQRRNEPHALAAALRGLGTGAMEPVWGRLGELAMPVTVIAGERDARYTAIARRLAQAIPGAALRVIPGGHGLVLESPRELADAICAGG